MRIAALISAFSLVASSAAGEFLLDLPVDCKLGETCHIQHFVDRDLGARSRDFKCGPVSYNTHKGTDFALPTLADMKRGVDVLAAADGIVAATRDGIEDRYYGPQNAQEVKGAECGNGVLLRHEGGFETQYCHLRKGSISVVKGQPVQSGDALGQIGLSGKTQFPHLHLSVRKNGEVIDPFDTSDRAECGIGGPDLWAQDLKYSPGGLLQIGFSNGLPSYETVRLGTANQDILPNNTSGLVLFAFAFMGYAQDRIDFTIHYPDGAVLLENSVTLPKAQSRYFRAAGKKLRTDRWPEGTYTGTVTLIRDGGTLDQATIDVLVK